MTVVKGNGMPSEAPAGSFAVAGPLCEAGDVFTQEAGGVVTSRSMPAPEVGDFVVFHDTGAYGASMSSNYNSRPLAPEVLVENGKPRLIRRRQTIEELIALETLGEQRLPFLESLEPMVPERRISTTPAASVGHDEGPAARLVGLVTLMLIAPAQCACTTQSSSRVPVRRA